MKITLKRVIAYLMDIILVSLVATFLTSNKYINKDYERYIKTYNEYEKYSNKYNDFLYDLEEFIDKDAITMEDLNLLIENYPEYKNYFEQINVDSIDDKENLTDIKEKVQEDYRLKEEDYAYKLAKLTVIQKIISILCILMYFVVIQYYLNGQTLGKKLVKLQVKSSSGKKLTILSYFIRSLILNEVAINILNIICISTLTKNVYITYNKVVYFVVYTLEMTILFMIMFDKNRRGLHDYVSDTIVEEVKE